MNMQSLAYELNVAAAKCARNATARFTVNGHQATEEPKFVAGAIVH